MRAVYWFAPGRNVALLNRTPSMSATTCCPVRPRMNGDPWLVLVCCTWTPSSPMSARGRTDDSRRPISPASVTVTTWGGRLEILGHAAEGRHGDGLVDGPDAECDFQTDVRRVFDTTDRRHSPNPAFCTAST